MEDEDIAQRLVEIARRHCKLVLEFGHKDTTVELRKVIHAQIEGLRKARTELIKNGLTGIGQGLTNM